MREKLKERLALFLDNRDVGMSKDQYLEMMEQMGEEPDWERCPDDWEDFPDLVIDALNIFYSLGDRVYADIGYTGKDFGSYKMLLKSYKIEKHQEEFILDTVLWLDGRAIEKSQKQIKAESDRLRRKHG